MTEAQKESEYFYIWKALCCGMIIFIHNPIPGTVGNIILVIARIGVPFFFAVSGWHLFRSSDAEQQEKQLKIKLKKTAWLTFRMCLIYMIFAAVVDAFCGVSISKSAAERFNPVQLLHLLLFNSSRTLDDYMYHLWYLFAMIGCYAALYCSKKLDRKFEPVQSKKSMIWILLAIMFILELTTDYLIWYRNWLFVGLPFILVGVYAKKNMIHTPPPSADFLRYCVKYGGKISSWS